MHEEIQPAALATWTAEDALIVDVREPWEFANGHVPGAVNIPLAGLAEHVDELREPMVLVCASGNRSGRAAEYLTTHAGFNRVANLLGGTNGWVQIGNALAFPAEGSSGGR